VKNRPAGGIYIGLGGNLSHAVYGPPRSTLEAALAELARRGLSVRRLSPWYRSAPVPVSDQPWFWNAVAEIASDSPADEVLAELHRVEDLFGRRRSVPNAARLIDLDLLDFRGEISAGGPGKAILPHPRMAERAFVVRPLADLTPEWRHPITGRPIAALLSALPTEQTIEKVA